MHGSAAHSFFAIPELVRWLSTHLSIPDLTQCILVCKDWSHLFQPWLWTDLDVDDRFIHRLSKVSSPTMATLIKNLGHIRTVEFGLADDTHLQPLIHGLPRQYGDTAGNSGTLCTNLQRISFYDFYEERLDLISRPLVMLLDHNPRLTHLEVSFVLFEIDGAPAAVSKLSRLQHLTVHPSTSRDRIAKPLRLLQSCLALPELTELIFINLEICWDDGDEGTVVQELKAIINEASRIRFHQSSKAKRIKSLRLPVSKEGLRDPLPLLLLKSNLLDLDTCHIPCFRPDADVREIEQVVRERCTNLKHLFCLSILDMAQDGEAERAFIRGCSGLQSFTTDYGPWMTLSELVSRHYTTLEVFEITDPYEVRSCNLQEVLSRCKQLRRFWMMGEYERARLSGISFRDISKGDWVCTELRELGVVLNRCRSWRDESGELEEEEEQKDPNVWLAASSTQRVYQQIGRLEKLEVLGIDIHRSYGTRAKEIDYAWDLTLSKGWLIELAGLKNLKCVELRADFWSAMGQAEVEFIHKHWPLLREIALPCDISEIHALSHWQWLLNERPQLRLLARNGRVGSTQLD